MGDNIAEMLEKTLSNDKMKQNPYNHQSRQQPELSPEALHFLTKSSGYSPGTNGTLVKELDYSNGHAAAAESNSKH